MASTSLPVRDLGGVGVISDINAYNLPFNGFTTGINVRFDEGKIKRAPVFRKVFSNLTAVTGTAFDPRACFGIVPATGFDTVLLAGDNFAL